MWQKFATDMQSWFFVFHGDCKYVLFEADWGNVNLSSKVFLLFDILWYFTRRRYVTFSTEKVNIQTAT
jgi:hypothetical protein